MLPEGQTSAWADAARIVYDVHKVIICGSARDTGMHWYCSWQGQENKLGNFCLSLHPIVPALQQPPVDKVIITGTKEEVVSRAAKSR